ncbi:hypothetical protein GGS20DRAFT_587982 [Poronia punctata]|nr:hypothetical protein GGS20DRAFT_587982 [Poronia punctata]
MSDIRLWDDKEEEIFSLQLERDTYPGSLGHPYRYRELDFEAGTQRFLILHPDDPESLLGDPPAVCHFEIARPEDVGPFIAVKNSRSSPFSVSAIIVDGAELIVPAALQYFLQSYDDEARPIRLWIRDICLDRGNARERDLYWSRFFSDEMYEKAEKAVDMAEYNARCVDKMGLWVFRQEWYADWKKARETLKQYELRPAPVRLGFDPHYSHSDRLLDYQYIPLDEVVGEHRLLVIHPGNGPLQTTLTHYPLNFTTYDAASYIPSTEPATAEITVTGQRMMVAPSLESFLKSLRGSHGNCIFWVDSLCIDQSNVVERRRHVRKVGRIFNSARLILRHLGEDVDPDVASEFLVSLNLAQAGQGPRPDQDPDKLAKLYKYLTNPYFKRIQTVGENSLTAATYLVGEKDYRGINEYYDVEIDDDMEEDDDDMEDASDADDLEDANDMDDNDNRDPEWASELVATSFCLRDTIRKYPLVAKTLERINPDIHVDLDELTYCQKLCFFSKYVTKQAQKYSISFCGLQNGAPRLLQTLVLLRSFEASDGHDKLFSCLPAARKEDLQWFDFEMDYAQPIPAAFSDFAIKWAQKDESLDIIAVAEPGPHVEGFYNEAPSWVPDWTTPARMMALVCEERLDVFCLSRHPEGRLYGADANANSIGSGEIRFSFENDVLHCTGLVVDQVDELFSVPERAEEGKPFFHLNDTFSKYTEWTEQISDHCESQEICRYDDPALAAVAMFHADVPYKWTEKVPEHPEPHESIFPYDYHRKKCDHPAPCPDNARYGDVKPLEIMRSAIRGRVAGMTQKGYMGLFPDYISQEGSGKPYLVSIIATCSVPVLLQERDDGTYKFCGSCFVQGFMYGEVCESRDADDFWDNVATTSEKLKIK